MRVANGQIHEKKFVFFVKEKRSICLMMAKTEAEKNNFYLIFFSLKFPLLCNVNMILEVIYYFIWTYGKTMEL